MKIFPFKISKPDDAALVYQEDEELIFYDKLHQHEEIQISLIVKGSGTLIVGDSISQYTSGDIVVIGGSLPHVLKSEPAVEKSIMLSLFFTKASFGVHFFELQELDSVRNFFNRSTNGFKVLSQKALIQEHFIALRESFKLERFIHLLQLLEILSKCKIKNLSSFVYGKQYSDIEGNRMRDVFEFTMNSFQEGITLKHVSEVAAMTKNAFCKYFKKRTNKSYFQFLTELRIEHACKLLINQSDWSIAEIAEQSGFNNIANFNRKFKAIKNVTPSKFRRMF